MAQSPEDVSTTGKTAALVIPEANFGEMISNEMLLFRQLFHRLAPAKLN
jgi:hypothetical protein